MNPPLQCPVCATDLLIDDSVLRCTSNHCFDIAREGYVNLLLSNQRKSGEAGDSKSMVKARRAYFAAGHYRAMVDCVCAAMPQEGVIVDAGCGTGAIFAAHAARAEDAIRIGLDISKPAVRTAAKDCENAYWLVSNFMRSMPVKSDSVDCLVNVMSPRNVAEFSRVLKPDGELLVVVPGEGHLTALREVLLMSDSEETRDPAGRADEAFAGVFTRTAQESILMELDLDAEAIQQLLAMTPLGWKSSQEGMARATDLSRLEDRACFDLLRYRCEG